MANPAKDLIGQTFGFLTVTKRAGTTVNTVNQCATWKCECKCGNVVIRRSQYLRAPHRTHPRSCGCQHGNRTHGGSHSVLFYKWEGMRERCYNPSCKDYRNWGARGITMCKRWRDSFKNFRADMEATYRPGLSLGRKDNNGPYSPQNCRWETAKQQANNTRRSVFIDTPKGRMTVTQAAEAYSLKKVTLHARLYRYGWTVARALNLSTT